MTNLKSVITDGHFFTFSRKSLRRWNSIKSTATPSVRLPLLLSVFLSVSAVLLHFSATAALGAALEPAITGAELVVDIGSSSKKSEHNVFF